MLKVCLKFTQPRNKAHARKNTEFIMNQVNSIYNKYK